MKKIINIGIARSGIHVFLLWIINNYADNSVLFYNNITDINNLDNRIITKKDTRVDNIKQNLINNKNTSHKVEIYSFESQLLNNKFFNNLTELFDLNIHEFTIVIRNPYNNYASILEYINNVGDSNVVHNLKDKFKDYWLCFSDYIIKNNPIYIIYDLFITNENYRIFISKKIGIIITNNSLIQSKFGNGSSFKNNNKDYLLRHNSYINDPNMIELLKDTKIKENWDKIIVSNIY